MEDQVEKQLYEENRQNMMDEISQMDVGNDDDSIKVESVDQVMELLKKLDGISDEERENMRLEILKHQAYAQAHGGYMIKEQIADTRSSSDFLVFSAMISMIVAIFVLFGYKLYKSLMEKQRKREEKAKAKQAKKKK